MDNEQQSSPQPLPQPQNSTKFSWKTWWVWVIIVFIIALAIFLINSGRKEMAYNDTIIPENDLIEEQLEEVDEVIPPVNQQETTPVAPGPQPPTSSPIEPETTLPEVEEEESIPLEPEEEEVICAPDCVNKECGDDGCGGSCGTCHPTHSCVDYKCIIPVLEM